MLKVARVREVWLTVSDRRYECVWAEAMGRGRGVRVAIAGFGASDCRCGSHLFGFDAEPSIVAFRRRLRGAERGHDAVVCRRV
ncbi:MAG: hypothetical protein CMJ49_14020 [Planctomycetaceae bacterium]|nr:hypothetical protein [Planctomycetaceae bacterium]